ncbi:hypothetical protein F4804DRAFT_340192 [Jackrogersella minutella]|nr:hypothetical protein F4804DRAFT_340192 [Jackrogersella minutella]
MSQRKIAWLASAARLLSSPTNAQDLTPGGGIGGGWGSWIQNQANSTLCWWDNLRVATLKNVVYLDGGQQQFTAGMIDGSLNMPIPDENPLGLIWTYNLSTPFNSTTNVSTLLGTMSKVGLGAANNIAPNFHDGALLFNDDEFFLYGGVLVQTSDYSPPAAETALGYMASQQSANDPNFRPGTFYSNLPEGMTRYVTFGASAAAPSENKAWYFGGYRSDSWGPIYTDASNSTYLPSNVSNTFITLDMSKQKAEVWNNVTLPTGTESRANPSMVWVPVGEQGILVVVGGVTYPDYITGAGSNGSTNEAQSKKDSPGFMSSIDVYDVAGKQWYRQPTQGAPPQLAQGCAVVATAKDYSSFNIYYYGGYDGLNEYGDFNDDVWVLSLPTFMWMKVTSSDPTHAHARAGHQCVMPYPDQMITIGGRTSYKGDVRTCLSGDPPGILQAYNLTAAAWMEGYDPDSWNEYGVPEMIHMMIGGDYSGGATMTAPTPWATPALGGVFATPYSTTKLTTYYPYGSNGPGNNTRGDYHASKGGTPSWVGAVLGVVLGLVFITAVVVGVFLYRKRRLLKKRGSSESSTDENRRDSTWIRDLQSNGKTPTITTDDNSTQVSGMESRSISPRYPEMGMVQRSEMPDTSLVELWDTSPRVELVGDTRNRTGLTHIADMKHSPFASNPQTPHSISTPTGHSFFGGTAAHDHASSISSQGPPPYTQRPDSPPLGANDAHFSSIASITSGADHSYSGSDVPGVDAGNNSAAAIPRRNTAISGLSDRDVGHLRQTSNTTVSSEATADAPPPPPASPPPDISPPTAGAADPAADYVSVPQQQRSGYPGGHHRHSIFVESEDDLGPGAGEAR